MSEPSDVIAGPPSEESLKNCGAVIICEALLYLGGYNDASGRAMALAHRYPVFDIRAELDRRVGSPRAAR